VYLYMVYLPPRAPWGVFNWRKSPASKSADVCTLLCKNILENGQWSTIIGPN
jgi:hypothetical protein